MFRIVIISFAAALGAITASAAQSDRRDDPASAAPDPKPVVVEMFLSQACSACPPAGDFMQSLAAREDVVALTWHIDYWNDAYTPGAGRWADPFSMPSFSERQRRYNEMIRGRRSIFTPQAIVNGGDSAVGSKPAVIETMIENAQPNERTPKISFQRHGETLFVSSDSMAPDELMMIAKFRRSDETAVTSGANVGITFVSAHIVEEVRHVTADEAANAPVIIERPSPENGCAVVVHNVENGAVVSAAYCPSGQDRENAE